MRHEKAKDVRTYLMIMVQAVNDGVLPGTPLLGPNEALRLLPIPMGEDEAV
jgi:hypothetical protein